MKFILLLLYFISFNLPAMNPGNSIRNQLEIIRELHQDPNASYDTQNNAEKILEGLLDNSQDQILSAEDLQALADPNYKSFHCLDKIRLLVDAYLRGGVKNIGCTKQLLIKIENILENNKTKYDRNSLLGRQMLERHYTPALIKKIHLSNNPDLINLFIEYLPMPNADLFIDGTMPEHIAKLEKEREQAVKKFLNNNNLNNNNIYTTTTTYSNLDNNNIKTPIEACIVIQRFVRGNQRDKEQVANLRSLLGDMNYTPEQVEQLIIESRVPYLPKCEKNLAAKIVRAAAEVKNLWPRVKHLTSTKYLDSIFDNGLMGRRTLRNNYQEFRPAALYQSDINYGDGNVVCLGPDMIDTQAYRGNTAEIVFDSEGLRQENNPCCFYKTADLGFSTSDFRTITFGKEALIFNQRYGNMRCPEPGQNYFVFNWSGQIYYHYDNFSAPTYPSCLHIFDNIEGMDTILTLYPFRYIDQLEQHKKDKIYSELNSMTHEQLVAKLTEFAQKSTNTAEFNFYGCYLAKFEHILEINFYNRDQCLWTMKLKDLIQELNLGPQGTLINNIKKDMPNLLKSYRFIDFLLSKITNQESKTMLLELRKQAQVPAWLDSDKN